MHLVEIKNSNGCLVASTGKVFGVRGKEVRGSVTDKGYVRVYIGGKGVRVHRLVAEAFIENPQCLTEVNHIDGNKKNNNVSNLEWVTHKANMHHAINTGLSKLPGKGDDGLRAILTNDQVSFIRKNVKKRDKEFSLSALARRFGVSVSCVHLVVEGRNWRHC